MPNTQTSTSTSRRRSSRNLHAGRGASAERSSGTSKAMANSTVETDDTYGIVSVLYHALQGAETIGQYIDDAKAADNPQLVAFFEDCRAKQNEIAMEGKRMLAEQLIDLVEDAEDEATSDEDDDE